MRVPVLVVRKEGVVLPLKLVQQIGRGGPPMSAERIAFRMTLHPGQAEEYERRHDEIFPELVTALKAAGVSDYSIWLDPGRATSGTCSRKPAARCRRAKRNASTRRGMPACSVATETC